MFRWQCTYRRLTPSAYGSGVNEWSPQVLTAEPAAPASESTTQVGRSRRITGIDMARGIAMAGMTVVHFVAWWEGEGALFTAAELLRGRAVPLFMLSLIHI